MKGFLQVQGCIAKKLLSAGVSECQPAGSHLKPRHNIVVSMEAEINPQQTHTWFISGAILIRNN